MSWLGLTPESTSGLDDKAGATRTLTVPTNFGNYTFVEKLVSYKEDSDGSFTLLFEQANGPIPYRNATGSFSGYWDTLSVKYAGAHESFIYFSNYLCTTGVVDDFNGFHEFATKNAESILQSKGQLTGHSTPPVSFQT
ncbi:MAG: hypothetical protein Q9202_007311 [Teloschistes flavicans]